MDQNELINRFEFHPADTDSKQLAHERVRAVCRGVALHLNDMLPEGREKSLVMTKLEEAMMWANASIARNNGEEQS